MVPLRGFDVRQMLRSGDERNQSVEAELKLVMVQLIMGCAGVEGLSNYAEF